MGEILMYYQTHEQFKNYCFIAVDLRMHELWAFVYVTSKWSFMLDFSSLTLPLIALKKVTTQIIYPAINFFSS